MTGDEGRTEPQPVDDGATAVTHDHGAGRPPTEDEQQAADRFVAEQDPEDAERVAEHYEEMRKIGADVKGEGEIE
jgi:hypothetical protein